MDLVRTRTGIGYEGAARSPVRAGCRQAALGAGVVMAAVAAWTGQVRASDADPASTASQPVQATCPVLVGNKIDPGIFVEYRGKKVYFCCQMCKSEFQKDLEKYLPRLPQFGGAGAPPQEGAGQAEKAFAPRELIEGMGITTLSLVALAVCTGLLRRLRPALLLKVHKAAGVLALAAGAVHATLVLLFG